MAQSCSSQGLRIISSNFSRVQYVGAEFMIFVNFWPIYYSIVRVAAKKSSFYSCPALRSFNPPPSGLSGSKTFGNEKKTFFKSSFFLSGTAFTPTPPP